MAERAGKKGKRKPHPPNNHSPRHSELPYFALRGWAGGLVVGRGLRAKARDSSASPIPPVFIAAFVAICFSRFLTWSSIVPLWDLGRGVGAVRLEGLCAFSRAWRI